MNSIQNTRGRKKSKAFDELGYELVKVNKRHAALCNICNKNILNTAAARLRAHRNVCKKVNKKIPSSSRQDDSDEDERSITYYGDARRDVLHLKAEKVDARMETNPLRNDNECSRSDSSEYTKASSSSEQRPRRLGSRKRKRSRSKHNSVANANFAGRLTQQEEAEIDESLAQFFFGCNIPLSAVDSVYFKNLVKKLQPAYADKIPNKKLLSTKLLDNAHEKIMASAKTTMSGDAVLLIEGWKSASGNTKTVVAMLRNENGEEIFLDAWNLTEEIETAEELADIVSESVDLAEKLYATQVYAVVSDNVSGMHNMKHAIWNFSCNSHTASLLVTDVLNNELNEKVTSVLKEFKQAELEKRMLEKGANRIRLPSEARCNSYRNAYDFLIENEQLMKRVAAGSKVKSSIVALLFDVKFISEVKRSLLVLDPICKIINKCQSKNCTAADAVDMWLNLKLPEQFSEQLTARQQQAVNKYTLAAFYIHPLLDNAKLNSEQNNIIFEFFFENLNGAGLEEWHSFKNKTGFFKRLYEKEIKSPHVFWSLAEIKCPNLAKLAKRLLQIPAATAQNSRILSRVHATTRHRLAFGRTKKLLCLYHSLRKKDVDEPEDCDFE